MNLVQIADDLKNLSDQQLAAMAQTPQSVPPYLVVAELKRRSDMRDGKVQPAPQSTVAQDVVQKAMMPPMAPQMQQIQGGGPPMANRPGMPPQQTGPSPMKFAGGGSVPLMNMDPSGQMALNNPVTMMMPDPYVAGIAPDFRPRTAQELMDLRKNNIGDPAEYMAKLETLLGPDKTDQIAGELAKLQSKVKSPKLGDFLMDLGMGMMASKRPDFLGGAGEAGISAMKNFRDRKLQAQEDIMKMVLQRASLEGARMQRRAGLAGMAVDQRNADSSAWNMANQESGTDARTMEEIRQRGLDRGVAEKHWEQEGPWRTAQARLLNAQARLAEMNLKQGSNGKSDLTDIEKYTYYSLIEGGMSPEAAYRKVKSMGHFDGSAGQKEDPLFKDMSKSYDGAMEALQKSPEYLAASPEEKQRMGIMAHQQAGQMLYMKYGPALMMKGGFGHLIPQLDAPPKAGDTTKPADKPSFMDRVGGVIGKLLTPSQSTLPRPSERNPGIAGLSVATPPFQAPGGKMVPSGLGTSAPYNGGGLGDLLKKRIAEGRARQDEYLRSHGYPVE